jgi:hypothetical protein
MTHYGDTQSWKEEAERWRERAERAERAEADNAALLALIKGSDFHVWEGSCPDSASDPSRDPNCKACRVLGGDTHPGAALLERVRALESFRDDMAKALDGWGHADECPAAQCDDEDASCECVNGEVQRLLSQVS